MDNRLRTKWSRKVDTLITEFQNWKKNSIRKILIINFPLESQVSEIFIVYSLRPTHGLKAGLTFDADHESFFQNFSIFNESSIIHVLFCKVEKYYYTKTEQRIQNFGRFVSTSKIKMFRSKSSERSVDLSISTLRVFFLSRSTDFFQNADLKNTNNAA